MKVTVITACFNGEEVIKTAIESVLRQSWSDLEYIVVDGASTDGTVEIIKEYASSYPQKIKWVSETSSSVYDAINKGIRMATGDVVGILNADDVLSDDRVIERVASAFGGSSLVHYCERSEVRESETANGEISRQDAKAQRGSERLGAFAPLREELGGGRTFDERLVVRTQRIEVGSSSTNELTNSRTNELLQAVYGDIRFVADRRGIGLEEIRAEPTVRYYSSRHWRPWMLQWGFMPPHPSVYIRRACFERLGDYALDYRIAADYALLVRFLRKARLNCRYVPMCFVDMRVGGMSTKNWRSNLLLNQEIVRGNREAGYFCCLPMLLPKYAFKVWEFVLPRLLRPRSGRNGECKNGRGAGGDARGACDRDLARGEPGDKPG